LVAVFNSQTVCDLLVIFKDHAKIRCFKKFFCSNQRQVDLKAKVDFVVFFDVIKGRFFAARRKVLRHFIKMQVKINETIINQFLLIRLKLMD
jgi:hypothetical protein